MLPIGCKSDVLTHYLPLEVGRVLTLDQAIRANRKNGGTSQLRTAAVGETVKIHTLSKGWIGSVESNHQAILKKLECGNFEVINAHHRNVRNLPDTKNVRYDREVV